MVKMSRVHLVARLATALLLLATSCSQSADGSQPAEKCAERVRDNVGRQAFTGFWDLDALRADGILAGDDSGIAFPRMPGIPPQETECLLAVGLHIVAYLSSPDLELDPSIFEAYERRGSEVGTELDFHESPFLADPMDNVVAAFDILAREGAYTAAINTDFLLSDAAVGVGVAPGETTEFDLVVVRIDPDDPEVGTTILVTLDDSSLLPELDASLAQVTRDGEDAVLRVPIVGDPNVWYSTAFEYDPLTWPM